MEYEFTVNGLLYTVDEYKEGWAWTRNNRKGQCLEEQQGYSLTAHDAQKSAIEHAERTMEDERYDAELASEERKYGTYQAQVIDLYHAKCL